MRPLDEAATELIAFRHSLHQCLNPWGDALFELCDAVLCSPHRVDSVPAAAWSRSFVAVTARSIKPWPVAVSTKSS